MRFLVIRVHLFCEKRIHLVLVNSVGERASGRREKHAMENHIRCSFVSARAADGNARKSWRCIKLTVYSM